MTDIERIANRLDELANELQAAVHSAQLSLDRLAISAGDVAILQYDMDEFRKSLEKAADND